MELQHSRKSPEVGTCLHGSTSALQTIPAVGRLHGRPECSLQLRKQALPAVHVQVAVFRMALNVLLLAAHDVPVYKRDVASLAADHMLRRF